MMRRFTWLVVPVLLAGCTPEGETADPGVSATATPSASASAAATPGTGGARQVSEETDTFLFEFSYPQAAGEIAGLAAWLDQRLERTRTSLAVEADEARADARANGFPFNQFASTTEWQVVTDMPDYLSLSADLSSYQGGAHPNYGFDSIVWDKANNIALEPIAFFVSPDALDAALHEELCAALDAEREERRGMEVDETSGDLFDTCIRPDETNLLLGSRGGQQFDRIGIRIAPYLAGPYAEGTYEFNFDMTEELLETVRPEYREAFATRN